MKKISMLITLLTMGATLISCNNASKSLYEDHLMNHPNKTFNNQHSSLNSKYVNSLQSFSMDFMEQVYSSDKNNVFSPISIATCFSMLLEGCKDNSKVELMSALHYDGSFNYTEEIQKMLLDTAINTIGYDDEIDAFLNISQSFFIDNSFSDNVSKDYLKTLQDYYFAEAFKGRLESDEMHDLLAKWINDKTNNFFDLKGKDFKDLAGLLWLVNATYLKARWFTEFYRYNDTLNFTSLDGSKKNASFISNMFIQNIYMNDDYMIGTIPLKDALYFRILLPTNVDNINTIFTSKTTYQDLLSPSEERLTKKIAEVTYTIPEFHEDKSYNLNDVFTGLNVNDIFNPGKANLKGISTKNDLYVNSSIHRAGIDVNIDGIEAAAFTIIQVGEAGIPPEYEKIKFTVDHPFMYSLGYVNERYNLPLFMGVKNYM